MEKWKFFILILQVQSNSFMLGGDVNVDIIIKHVMDTITKGDNLGIQSNCSWMLGHLYLSACAVAETRASGNYINIVLKCK